MEPSQATTHFTEEMAQTESTEEQDMTIFTEKMVEITFMEAQGKTPSGEVTSTTGFTPEPVGTLCSVATDATG